MSTFNFQFIQRVGITVPLLSCSWEGLLLQGSVFRHYDGASGFHQGYGSCIRVSSSSGELGHKISGQMIDSDVILKGDYLGKGLYSATLSGSQNFGKLFEIEADPFSRGHLSRDGDYIPDFEGRPDSGVERIRKLLSPLKE